MHGNPQRPRSALRPIDWARMYASIDSREPVRPAHRHTQDVLPLHWPTYPGCSCGRTDCRAVGKHPLTLNGKDDATDDPDMITQWWTRWPEANIGVRPPVGTIVLDIDPRNGGDERIIALARRYGTPTKDRYGLPAYYDDIPRGRMVWTGGGGLHIWMLYDGPVPGRLATGIDVKSHSGYVVMPPSLHESGGRYRVGGLEDIEPAPAWLAELLTFRATPPAETQAPPADPDTIYDVASLEGWGRHTHMGYTPARAAGLLEFVEQSREGERNKRFHWACCRALQHGMDLDPLKVAAVATGLPEFEVERTAHSATRSVRRGQR